METPSWGPGARPGLRLLIPGCLATNLPLWPPWPGDSTWLPLRMHLLGMFFCSQLGVQWSVCCFQLAVPLSCLERPGPWLSQMSKAGLEGLGPLHPLFLVGQCALDPSFSLCLGLHMWPGWGQCQAQSFTALDRCSISERRWGRPNEGRRLRDSMQLLSLCCTLWPVGASLASTLV